MEDNSTAPLVSVIMAAYNAEKTIGPAIRSVLRQTYQNLELIIVDDASRDGTVEVVQSFTDRRVRLIRNPVNLKQGLARNIAIERAEGQFIAILDADDLSLPVRLEKQVEFLLANPEVDVVGTNAYLFDETGTILWSLVKKGNTHHELTARMNQEMPLIHATIMGRTNWFGNYSYAPYPRSQDRDLFLRSYRYSHFANLSQCLYACRDPGRVSIRKLVLASWTNLIMRLRHRREYGLPIASVLGYPLLLAGKWLYWGLLALQGKSLFALPGQKIMPDDQFYCDHAWITHCLNSPPQSDGSAVYTRVLLSC